jgi:hypothetical protein
MRREVFVVWVVVAAAGCWTTTAHRLPVTSNPLRAEAETCERHCRSLAPPADRASYAACLDSCPGATADDGQSCPLPPSPGVVCAETHKASKGGFAAGIWVVIGLVALSLWAVANTRPAFTF